MAEQIIDIQTLIKGSRVLSQEKAEIQLILSILFVSLEELANTRVVPKYERTNIFSAKTERGQLHFKGYRNSKFHVSPILTFEPEGEDQIDLIHKLEGIATHIPFSKIGMIHEVMPQLLEELRKRHPLTDANLRKYCDAAERF